ncbi:response regulator transcription factor [Luedemannella helvata]|uniref:Response regulator transcription factor n=1 Tax=Luedemannella helvata TaxID=349315 RepID=A0ABP4WP43_9ACTN
MTRVVLADDAVLLRTGLRRVLEAEGFEVAAEAGDAEALLRAVDAYTPELAIVDIRMPPTWTTEGVRAAAAVRRRHPRVGVLLLSQHIERREALAVLEHRGAGGVGYLLKDRVCDIDAFVAQVRRVAAGGTAIDPLVVAQVLRRPAAASGIAVLSAREREILARMAEGRSNAGVAAELHLAERTVETHVRSIFTKLGLHEEPDTNRRVLAVLTHLSAA